MSAGAVASLFAQESDVIWKALLTLSHPSIDTMRAVNDVTPIVSRYVRFDAFPFTLVLPTDIAERIGTGRLLITNVDRRLVEAVRSVDGPMKAKIEYVTLRTPDIVELELPDLEMSYADGDEAVIAGTLKYGSVEVRRFPAHRYDPQQFPGLHGRAAAPS
jgi:hypothetical protein